LDLVLSSPLVSYPPFPFHVLEWLDTLDLVPFLTPTLTRDVVLGLGPWSLVVLKDKIAVLGPGLGLEPSVLGPVLGLAC